MSLDPSGCIVTTTMPVNTPNGVVVSQALYNVLREAGLLQPIGQITGANFTLPMYSFPGTQNRYLCWLISTETITPSVGVVP